MRKIIDAVKEDGKILFELSDKTVIEKELEISDRALKILIGEDFDGIFGVVRQEPKPAEKIEVDKEVFDNMQKTIQQMSAWQAQQQHNQLENSRLVDVLNRRRSGEDTMPTKADLMESQREQQRTTIYEERKLIFKEKTEREKTEFMKEQGDIIRENLEKYGNMTGSPIRAKIGDGQEEHNNVVFGGGRR